VPSNPKSLSLPLSSPKSTPILAKISIKASRLKLFLQFLSFSHSWLQGLISKFFFSL